MRGIKFVAPGVALLLAGCAGSVVGDAIKGPEKLAFEDDAYCRSIRAFGDAYTNCRLLVSQQRDNRHGRALNAAAGALQAASSPTQCVTTGPVWARTTTCY